MPFPSLFYQRGPKAESECVSHKTRASRVSRDHHAPHIQICYSPNFEIATTHLDSTSVKEGEVTT